MPAPAHLSRPFCFECGKEALPSEAKARATLANYTRKHKRGQGGHRQREQRRQPPNQVYPCPSGNGWHLTKNEGLTRRNRKESR
jgi:hypothetical protein